MTSCHLDVLVNGENLNDDAFDRVISVKVQCGWTDLDLSFSRRAQRQQFGTEQGLELDGAAGGCDHVDHLYT